MHDSTGPASSTPVGTAAHAPLPTGTITFMLTDVEGSTKMWREHPEAMFKAAARHHEIIHGAVHRWGGALPRDQGEGDSVFAAFARATRCGRRCAGYRKAKISFAAWETNKVSRDR
ncbi:MAG: hypothetical protein M3285_11280 [Actinomycetota bacterium]|nr:hypothetical protein [Actinomycetota bacterium]